MWEALHCGGRASEKGALRHVSGSGSSGSGACREVCALKQPGSCFGPDPRQVGPTCVAALVPAPVGERPLWSLPGPSGISGLPGPG